MARERWFYAEGHRRMGPVPRRELVEVLLQLTDPRACLVWRHGLPAWTPAANIPEIDQQLAPFAGREVPSPSPSPSPLPSPSLAPEPARPTVEVSSPRRGPRREAAATARHEAQGQRPRGGSLYVGGVALAVLVLVGVSWLWWSLRRPAAVTDPGHSAATDTRSASNPLPSTDATPTPAAAAGGGQGFAGWADQESELPQAELRRLRGVGAWTGDKLTITVYNASSWRVTEIVVRTSLMEADRFVDAVEPHRLSPAGAAPVDAAVGELLNRVAPNRKRAGVNPADTGPFEATVGPQPAGYRWRIEGARGYPPR